MAVINELFYTWLHMCMVVYTYDRSMCMYLYGCMYLYMVIFMTAKRMYESVPISMYTCCVHASITIYI